MICRFRVMDMKTRRNPGNPRATLLLLFALTLLSRADARPLSGLSEDELKQLEPALSRGVASVIEADPQGKLKQVILATDIKARIETVYSLISKPEQYPKFMHNFENIEITDHHENMTGFNWEWVGSKMSFRGVCMLTSYPPKRVNVEILKSALGQGQVRVDLTDRGSSVTTAVLSMVLNIETSNWIVQWLVKNHPTMRQAINLANGYVFMEGLKRGAEAREKGKEMSPIQGQAGGQAPSLPDYLLTAVEPLLKRGSVGFTESYPQGRLHYASVLQSVYTSPERIATVINRPSDYPAFIKLVKEVGHVSYSAERTLFSWKLGFPLTTLSSTCQLEKKANGHTLRITDGDLKGSNWLWQVSVKSPTRSVVSFNGWADIAETNFIFRNMLKREPLFEHGFNLASDFVFVRGIRGRSEGWL